MRAWTRRGLLAWVLWPVSLLFRAMVALRRFCYATGLLTSYRLPVPVIVVGNLFVGGTGKTPLTIWLVEALRDAGFVPGVISRGYGARNGSPQPASSDSAPDQVGDEPVLIARRAQCPVMVGRDRVAAGRALLTASPQVNVIVADDGLQHYALARALEIVLFDARGAGNGWLLPAGPLREPIARTRDFTVVNAPSLPTGMPADAIGMQLVGVVAERLSDPSQRLALTAELVLPETGRPAARIVAAAGIGNPARFFALLRDTGLIFDEMPLPDHFDFSINPFADVVAEMILITEKDAVKCARIDQLKKDLRLWVVPVTARVDRVLAERIVEKLRGPSTA